MRTKLLSLLTIFCFTLFPDCSFSQADSLISDSLLIYTSVKELKANMKYQFALTFALQRGVSYRVEDYKFGGIDTFSRSNPNVLQEFECGMHYIVFRHRSFNGTKQYFLL